MLRVALAPIFAFILAVVLAAPAPAAEVQGAKINYTSQGAGPTVIFVHGWTCDLTSWDAQVPAFAGKYRAIALDLPGHGRTPAPRDGKLSMNLFAAAVEAVRAETGATKVVLVGHSMGAVVIRQYAVAHPDRVAGLVAVDGPLNLAEFDQRFQGQPLPDMTGAAGLERRRGMIAGMFTPDTPKPTQQKVVAMMMAPPEATASGAMAAMFDPAIRTKDVIPAPALSVLAGTAAKPDPQATMAVLPNWRFEQFAGTGHFVMMEQPVRFNATLEAFLATRAKW